MKIINFRAFLFVFAAAAAGILFSLTACYALPLGIALLAVLFAFTALLAVRAAVKKDFYKLAAYAVAFAVTLYLVIAFFVIIETRYELANGGTYTLTGRVTERFVISTDEEGVVYFKAALDDLSAEGRSIGGKLSIRVKNADRKFDEISCGYSLTFSSEISRFELIDDRGINAGQVRSDLRYAAACKATDVLGIGPGDPQLLENARLSLRHKLTEFMGNDAGNVAYGMISGDKYLLDDGIADAYAAAGIGHILAVSGLHIGLVSFVLCSLLSKLPLPRNVPRVLVTLLLLAYAVFAGGSPSAVRAFVMCAIGIWAAAFGKRDDLNALCAGAVVCLCISPFYLFECGYLLSVSAVFGLIAFAKPTESALMRLRIPKFAAGAVSSSLSVQFAVSPVIAFFFHRFYLYSFFSNALGIGLLSAFFALFTVVLPFALLPPLGILLVPFGYAIGSVTQACFFISALPFAATVLHVSVVVFLLLPMGFALSRFVMLPRKFAANVVLLGLIATVAMGAENSVKASDALLAVGSTDTFTVIYRGKEKYLLGDFGYDGRTDIDNGSRVGGGEFTVYADDLTELAAKNILAIGILRQIKEVRVPVTESMSGLAVLTSAGVEVTCIDGSDGLFDTAYADGEFAGWLYASEGRTAYITSRAAAPSVSMTADVVRCRTADNSYPAPLYITAYGGRSPMTVTASVGRPVLYDFTTGEYRSA